MAEIDIFNSEKRYENAVRKLKESSISQENKKLILRFAGDCLIGWGGKKLKKIRVLKYLILLRTLAEILGKDFNYITTEDVKRLISEIDSDPDKGEWSQHDYRITLRKFVKWLREEHGYPKDYPNSKYLTKILPLIKYPEEVKKIQIKTPDKQKPREEIPTQEEMRFLREASLNARDKALFAIWEEVGPRIGGLGSRQIKHVEFDELGALLYMKDKTMKGEPIRLISSASYLRDWYESHSFKNDPESPLWLNLEKSKPEPLYYDALIRMIQRTIRRHNRKAESNGLPKITRRIHPHGFRYFAQIRDELDGIPRSVQKKQRGWSFRSKMPDKYAAIVTKDVDDYYKKKFGLNGSNDNNNNKPISCPRCKEVNFPKTLYCKRCGLPLDEKAKKYDSVIDDLIEKIILDPELSQRLREKLLEIKSGGEA